GSIRPAGAASGRTRNKLRVSRSAPVEDDEYAQLLVGAERVLGAGFDERGRAFRDRERLVLDLDYAVPLQDDVDLVVLVRLLAVGFGRDEHVHAELEPGRPVSDLVAAAGGYETGLDC